MSFSLKNLFGGLFHKQRSDYKYDLFSPNGRLRVVFSLQKGTVFYSIKKDDKEIIRDSKMEFEVEGISDPTGTGMSFVRVHDRSSDTTWETNWGEERVIRNNYNEAAFYLSQVDGDKRIFTIRFRVFDDGIAFRYEFPIQNDLDKLVILNEKTQFRVDINSTAWSINAYQPDRYEYLYKKSSISMMNSSVHTPLTIKTTSGHYISIHEAALYDYGAMNIKKDGDSLVSDITPLADGKRAYVNLPFNTPWRTVIVAHNAVELTASRMILNLNESPVMDDTKWIKPTKFMGIWWGMFLGEFTWAGGERHGASTKNAYEYIDHCKKYGIPALLIEGWNYTWDGDWIENGSIFNFTQPYPDFEIKRVVEYAKANGVEIIGHHETAGDVENYERQMEAAFMYYHELGIKYVKLGYVGSKMNHEEYHHSQYGVRHYQKVVEMAAKYGMMLDIHEPIKGTGIERTWPNLLTREGARGQEYEGGGITPDHAAMLPYTRSLSGPFDYTPGLFDITNYTKRVASTLARQLAFYVTIFSPMQMVADRPKYYEDQPAFKFIQDVPVNWEKTVPLFGEVGEFFVTARKDRDSDDWYVGGVTDETARKMNVYFDFLDDGREYVAEVYEDSTDAHYRDHQLGIAIWNTRIKKGDNLSVYMASGGGFAVRVRAV